MRWARKWRLLLLFLFAPLLAGGCATPFVVGCREEAKRTEGEFKYTDRQAALACDRAQFYADPHLILFDKEKKVWELNPNGLLTADLRKVIEDQVKSIDVLLGYADREEADQIDWVKGFRKGLEREEQIALEILRRLRFVDTYNEFTDKVGELPLSFRPSEVSYFFPAGRKFYSMKILYPPRRLEGIPFTAEYLETAKREGVLQLIDTFEVSSTRQFAKKIPHLYDANDFYWEDEGRGWLIQSFRVMSSKEKPADNIVHYIEIFRKKKDMNGPEEKPAVRGFMTAGGSKVSVFIVDYDREGTAGYGTPDKLVQTFTDVATGGDLFSNETLRNKLLEALYDAPQNNPRDKPERKRPQDPQIYTEIVKMGEAPIDLWEKGSWSVPFEYKILSTNLEIKYHKPKTVEEQRLEEKDKLKKIELFIQGFQQSGKKVVIEYWIPKDQYKDHNIMDASAYSATISLRRKGHAKEEADITHFGGRVKVVNYLYAGKWFQIVDEDGDEVFEKKREIADPTASTGSAARVDEHRDF